MKANSCCDLLRNRRNFKQSPSIDSRDLLSSLPVDCVNPVFEFLNHDDLDVLMVVSQWMGRLAIEIRPKIKRKPAESLDICLMSPQNICVCLRVSEHLHLVSNVSSTTTWNRQSTIRERRAAPNYFKGSAWAELPCSAYERIRYLSDLFEPSHLCISNVLIGRKFLNHCEQAFNNYTFLNIENTDFIESFQISEQTKLINWIISMRLKSCFLNFSKPCSDMFNCKLLESIVQNSNIRTLSLQYENVHRALDKSIQLDHVPPLPLHFHDEICKFDTLDLKCFEITADRFMDIILKRIILQTKGTLCLNTTSAINLALVRKSIELNQTFQLSTSFGKFDIKHAELKWKAAIFPWSHRHGAKVDFEKYS